MSFRSRTARYSGRLYGRMGSRSQRSAWRGQGGMRAEYSGAVPIIRHSIESTSSSGSTADIALADGKARAYPLVVYFGTSGTVTDGVSNVVTTSEGSRVNHTTVNLSITQSDSTKPNQVYVGMIAVSFSEAFLSDAMMTKNFADLISASSEDNGYVTPWGSSQDLNYKEWTENAALRHNVRGFQRNTITLYSGRPAIRNSVISIPPKCRRQQFGSAVFLVVMNDSSGMQNVEEGSATDIHVSLRTFFKEIPPVATAET